MRDAFASEAVGARSSRVARKPRHRAYSTAAKDERELQIPCDATMCIPWCSARRRRVVSERRGNGSTTLRLRPRGRTVRRRARPHRATHYDRRCGGAAANGRPDLRANVRAPAAQLVRVASKGCEAGRRSRRGTRGSVARGAGEEMSGLHYVSSPSQARFSCGVASPPRSASSARCQAEPARQCSLTRV